MGWGDFKNPFSVEFMENQGFVPSSTEQIPQNPQIPTQAGSESPDLTLIDHLTEAEREYYFDLLEIMQSPKFGMVRETAAREAGEIITEYRLRKKQRLERGERVSPLKQQSER